MKISYPTTAALMVCAAITQPVTAGTYARIGFDGGGDKLSIPAVTDKGVRAGNGVLIEVGLNSRKDKTLSSGQSSEFSLGIKVAERGTSDTFDSGDSIAFGRLSLNATHFLHKGDWRIGGGLTYHLGNSLVYDIDGESETEQEYDGAAGLTLQIDRMFYEGLYRVGVKGTAIEYKSDESPTVDGSSIGFYAGMYF